MIETHILHNYEALGTLWHVDISTEKELKSSERIFIQAALTHVLQHFERTYSRFVLTSLITQLNKKRIIKNPPQDLVNMITLAEQVRVETGGLYSIHIGRNLMHNGYGPYIKPEKLSPSEPSCRIDTLQQSIHLEGDEYIDLGSLGKGYCLGLISRCLEKNGYQHHIVNGGGDIYATTKSNGEAYVVTIQDPHIQDRVALSIDLRNGSVCCLSPLVRIWHYEGKKQTHIVIPHTASLQAPHTIFSTMIIAQDPCIADCLATAYMLIPTTLCHTLATRYHVQWRRWE